MTRRAVTCFVLLVAPVVLAQARADEASGGPVTVKLTALHADVSEDDKRYIEEAIATASSSERLATWGGLTSAVSVEIHPAAHMLANGGEAFGLAVGKGLIKLRAPKDTVSWGRPLPYQKTMLHELGHILEHQRAGLQRPRWFAEGFANLVADFSGYASKEDVAYWVIARGGEAPLDRLFKDGSSPHVAYAVATEAVNLMLELVKEDGLRRFFALRLSGVRFEAAFEQVAGFGLAEFQRRFIERVRPDFHARAE